MHNSMKNKKSTIFQKGFSILEIAIVMVLVGLVVTPAISIYHQHRVEKDWDEVTDEIYDIANEVGGYRAVFGRYPCPASTAASPGDNDYGHEFAADCVEDAPAVGSCVGGICTHLSTIPGKLVVVGSLPYKVLNLQEQEAYNSDKSRYTYAVTLDLTNNVSFDLSGGGISIVDKNDPTYSLVSPPGTAHFVVLSHGENMAGAISRNGLIGRPCTAGSAAEQENCDSDAVFISGDYDSNSFDDRLKFFSPVTPSEWQISQNDLLSIHMKNTDSIAVGANMTTNLTSADQTTILSIGADTGSAKSTTKFISEKLCKYNTASAADCFEPELIAGKLTSGALRLEAETNNEGMSCYKPSATPSQDNYMTGIANGHILCADEIYMTCPNGSYVQGIDGNGNVECSDGLPLSRCLDKNISTVCGNPATLTETFSGDSKAVYSGECRNFKPINDRDAAWFASKLSSMTTFPQIQAMITNANNKTRLVGDCGTDYTDQDTQTRDSYECNSGSWDHLRSHEKRYYYNNFPSNLDQSGSYYNVENGGASSPDPSNTAGDHDCWCREDFRVRTQSCSGNLSGFVAIIEKHPCPQTFHRWVEVYRSSTEFCECAPRPDPEWVRCNDYYDEIKPETGTNGLNSWVRKNFDITCPTGPLGPAVRSATPSSVDEWCNCKNDTQNVDKTSCDLHYTNSWVWPVDGSTQTGIETLEVSDWICPATTTPDGYGNNIQDPAYRDSPVPYGPIPACLCIDKDPGTTTKPCPAGQQGTGITYIREWDCSLNGGVGNWEPEEDWTVQTNSCHSCAWQPPVGTPTTEEYAYGETKGETCACGESAATQCHSYAGNGDYDVWNGCPCVVQLP